MIDDLVDGTALQLWTLPHSTLPSFPDLEIQCRYDAATKRLLDQLQQDGLLRWSDAGNLVRDMHGSNSSDGF
jgi:hypothetical protein